jgi:hypothetical protein
VQEQCCEGNDEQQERRPAAEQSGTRVPTPPPWGHARNNVRHDNEGANVVANADGDVDVPQLFRRASQNLVAAAIFLRGCPKAATSEERQVRQQLKALLEAAAAQ